MILGTSLLERRADASHRYIHVGSRPGCRITTSLLRSVQQRCTEDHALPNFPERQGIREVGAIVADYPVDARKGWVKPAIRQKINSFVPDPWIRAQSVNKSTSR